MSRHYALSPSASSRWLNCPGSLTLGGEKSGNRYADEGTDAHRLAELALKNGQVVEDPHVLTYVDECRAIQRRGKLCSTDVEITLVSDTVDGLGGTLDFLCVYLEDGEAVAHLADLKYGQGVPVYAEGNSQLMTYAALVDEHFVGQIDRYRLTIVQPRCVDNDDVQTVDVSRDEVEAHRDRIIGVVGADHRCVGAWCRWCPGAAGCPEMREHTLKCAREEFDLADVGQLVELMNVAPAVKSFLDKIPGEVLKHLKRGSKVPGFKAIQSLSNRRWRGDADEICQVLGVDIDVVTERKLVTPAQAEKRGVSKETVSTITYREELGIKVVPEKSRGEAIDFSLSEFEDISNG